jgi:phosphonate transport system permease protein
MSSPARTAANPPYRLPPRLFSARCRACWFTLAVVVLVVTSFWSLDLQWAQFFSLAAVHSMGRFLGEFFPPETSPEFLRKVLEGTWQTLAMSALGTGLAAVAGLLLALPASRLHAGDAALARGPTRLLLNVLRAIPELVWAGLLLIAAGLGPFAGTLALAAHTTGVLGRLFAEALENAATGPGDALRAQGVDKRRVFLFATLPQVLPQLMSYTLYRWENNIRAATVLGAMLLLVAAVDAMSYATRRGMTR